MQQRKGLKCLRVMPARYGSITFLGFNFLKSEEAARELGFQQDLKKNVKEHRRRYGGQEGHPPFGPVHQAE